MTTVYGVTKYGARAQVARQLEDIEEFPQNRMKEATTYLVNKTFQCLQEMFTSTKQIQVGASLEKLQVIRSYPLTLSVPGASMVLVWFCLSGVVCDLCRLDLHVLQASVMGDSPWLASRAALPQAYSPANAQAERGQVPGHGQARACTLFRVSCLIPRPDQVLTPGQN